MLSINRWLARGRRRRAARRRAASIFIRARAPIDSCDAGASGSSAVQDTVAPPQMVVSLLPPLLLMCASTASVSGGKLAPSTTVAPTLVVEITGGAVRGELVDPPAGGSSPVGMRRVVQWLGVPYAAPPVGDLRWRPPQRPAAWRPVVRLPVWNEGCTQVKHAHPLAYTKGGEDCLYLNIFAPAFNGTAIARLPVMLWIHGGGYMVGSGTGNDTNGAYDVAHLPSPMVIVSINYRLNIFGFGASDALRPRDPLGGTGNYGLLDQRMAMQWVQVRPWAPPAA
eukprot:COSAG01_NODE_2460_length_7655_cov_15.411858_4_plen_281_part_00